MKFQDVVGDPAPLAVDLADTPLPTTADLMRHAYNLIETAKRDGDPWTISNVWNRVADDIVALYDNRNVPVMTAANIAR